MERKQQNQVRQKRSKSKGKLQTQYRIQSLPTYNLFVKDCTTQLTSKEMKFSCSLLCASSTTENAEIQTLESIQQHKKNSNKNDKQLVINENSKVQLSEQNDEKTSYVIFPDSLLTEYKNSELLSRIQTFTSKLKKEMVVQEKEYVQNKQKTFQITEQGRKIKANTQSEQKIKTHNFCLNQNSCKDIKTVKILPINNNSIFDMKYIEIACQTDVSYVNLNYMKEEKNQRDDLEQYRSLNKEEVKQSKTSIEINLQQNKFCNIESDQKQKKIQDENDSFSQCSEKEVINKIWKEDLFMLKHEELNQIHQRYIESQTQSQQNEGEIFKVYKEKEKKNIFQLQIIKQKNQKLMSQLYQINQNLNLGKLQEKQLKMEKKQLQLNIINLSQKLNQVLEENKELVCLVQQYKQKIFDFQVSFQLSKSNLNMLQKQLNDTQLLIIKKDEEIYEISKQLKNYKQDCVEFRLVNSQLQQILKEKQEQLQQKMVQLQKQKSCLNDIVFFYKQKLNEDGITLNLEQLKYIKEYIQNQNDLQTEKIQSIKENYKKEINNLQHQKAAYIKIISQLEQDRQLWKKEINQRKLQSLPKQVEQLIKQYDRQLEVRDEQILKLKNKLKKQQSVEKQFYINNCSIYIQHVKDLYNLIESKKDGFKQTQVEFIYIVDKLLRIYYILDKKNSILQSEKRKMVTLVKNMEEFYREQLQTFKTQVDEREIKIKSLQQKIQKQKKQSHNMKQEIEILKNIQETQRKTRAQNSQNLKILQQEKKKRYQSLIQHEKEIIIQDEIQQQRELKFIKIKNFFQIKVYTEQEKLRISEKLVKEIKIRLKNSTKLESLYISKIYIREENGNYEVKFKKIQKNEESNCHKEMLYFAPQVLLGFGNSQQSYVWTLGIIIDQLYGGSLFYKKLNEIKSIQENYYCRKPQIEVRNMLEKILKKNQKKRISLQQIEIQISKKLQQMRRKK